MEIVYINVNELTPDEMNAKIHQDDDINVIVKSIKKYQFCDPIGVWGPQNLIVEGHGRYLACKKLGIESVPCIRLDHLSDKQRQEYAIVHNKSTMLTGFDEDILKSVLPNIDLDDFNFDFGFGEDDDKEVEEVEIPPLPAEPNSKLGQIYQLGEHTLMCGDSTSSETIKKLLADKLVDMVMTDPPYNVNVSNSDGLTIENDNLEKSAFENFINDAFFNLSVALKPGGVFYIWYGDVEDVAFRTACFNNQLSIRECLIWVKNSFNLGRQDYQWRHEPCLYGWKEGAAHYFVDDRSQDTVIEDKIDINKLKKSEMAELLKKLLYDNGIATTVIHENKPVKNDLHPTMKPLKMIAQLIRNSSKIGETVLDLFGGSGSTLIACEQIKRKCYMVEYDPRYVDVIIERWEKYTGKKARLIYDSCGD